MNIPYHTAPNKFGDTWQRYIEHGISPGSFGTALLCNDLMSAALRADVDNRRLLADHTLWLFEYMPWQAWGDEDRYMKVIEDGGIKGVYPMLRAIEGGLSIAK